MFSVIITCFNRENVISNAIFSVLNQSYQDFEIIVVDDGSSDNSVDIIKSIQDDRIRLIQHVTNQGQNAALNTGCLNAKYELLAFLDSDDIWLPNCLELYNKEFTEKPGIGFTYGLLDGGEVWSLEGNLKYAEVLSQGYLCTPITLAIRKSLLVEVGYFDLKYSICQDDDICMRLSKVSSFSVINKPIARTGTAGDNMTLNKIKLADGWYFFFHNYKSEIIKFCGYAVWGRHLITLSKYYFDSESLKKSILLHLRGILLLFFFEDRYLNEKNYHIKRLKKCLKKYLVAKYA